MPACLSCLTLIPAGGSGHSKNRSSQVNYFGLIVVAFCICAKRRVISFLACSSLSGTEWLNEYVLYFLLAFWRMFLRSSRKVSLVFTRSWSFTGIPWFEVWMMKIALNIKWVCSEWGDKDDIEKNMVLASRWLSLPVLWVTVKNYSRINVIHCVWAWTVITDMESTEESF